MLKKQTLLARQTTSPYLSDSGCQRHRRFSCESTEQLVHFSMATGSCYCLSCQPILETEMRDGDERERGEREGERVGDERDGDERDGDERERERGVGEMGEKGERWDI